MKPSRSVLASMFVSVLLVGPVTISQAQESSARPVPREGLAGIGFGETPLLGLELLQPIEGVPYSADQESEQTQTLADGTNIHRKLRATRIYRDSLGRTRTERFLFGPLQAANNAQRKEPTLIQIYDPVAGYMYMLQVQKHNARRVPVKSSRATVADTTQLSTGGTDGIVPAVQPAAQAPKRRLHARRGPEATEESLGSELIDGIQAEGTRRTVTFPEGLVGNDRPLVRVCEKWYSRELKIVVLNKCADPRLGETTLRIRNIERSEPDATLFQVPEDYTIEDAKDRFAMGYVGSFP
jgi:hypothetical protein